MTIVILKNLLYRKARTLLTVLGIAVGGGVAVVARGALADGLVAGYSTLSRGGGVGILVM